MVRAMDFHPCQFKYDITEQDNHIDEWQPKPNMTNSHFIEGNLSLPNNTFHY